MRVKCAAAVVAATMAWPISVSAEGPGARGRQAVGPVPVTASLDAASAYFEHARKVGFPAAAAGAPYVLKAEFTTRGSSGAVQSGTYTDTWMSDTQWRREAVLGKSRFVRSRNGKRKFYRVDEGPDAEVLQFVLTAMEPIPDTRAVRNSDWKVRRDMVDGVTTVRVATGHENPDGTPDPQDFKAYWFDETGQLVRSYAHSMETRWSKFEDFNGMSVARRVEVMLAGKVALRIDVTGLGPAGVVDPHVFSIKGHDWKRDYATEVR